MDQTTTSAGQGGSFGAGVFSTWPPTLDAGPGLAGRIGLLALSNDIVIEGEVRHLLAGLDVGLHVGRVAMPRFGSVEALGALREHLGAAVATLVPRNTLDVIAFGCTAASAIIGEAEVTRLIQAARGAAVACTNPIAAAARCMAAQGARRIAILSPYPEQVCAITAGFLRQGGFEVCRVVSFDTVGDETISRIAPRTIFEAAKDLCTADVDTVFISCTALRVVELIAPLEAASGHLVVTSNQAMVADALRHLPRAGTPQGFGRCRVAGKSETRQNLNVLLRIN